MSDALASLRTALAPKGGMKRIPLPTESYQHVSKPLASMRLLNMFPEQEPKDARTDVALLPTPGLSQFLVLSAGPCQAMSSERVESIYAVSAGHFWRIPKLSIGPAEDLGFVGTVAPNFVVSIAVGSTAAVVCVPPFAYTCGHNPGDPMVPILGDFPGASSVAYLDGYFIFSSYLGQTSQFFISGLLDPLSYSALDFAYADTYPNTISRVITLRGDVWVFGESGIEVWYDAGTAGTGADLDFPFRRRDGAAIGIPVGHPRSIAIGDGSVFWVGADDNVYRSAGYRPELISTPAISKAIHDAVGVESGGGAFSVTSAFTYTQRGHTFYCVSFLGENGDPQDITQGITLAYDCATKKWADRASDVNGTGRWRAQFSAVYSDLVLFGDFATGAVWRSFPDIGTENGVEVIRSVTLPPLWGGTHRTFCHRLEIEMEVGGDHPPGTLQLEWSDDGGTTWNGQRTLATAGAQGLRQRVFATRLGSFRQRVYRIVTRGHTTIYAVDADLSAPGSQNGSTA